METVFALGRDPELSLLEIASCLKAWGITPKVLGFDKRTALLELPAGFDLHDFFHELGGSLKACQVIWRGKPNEFRAEKLREFMDRQYFDRKMLYGISDYRPEGTRENEGRKIAEFAGNFFKGGKIKAVLKKPKIHSEEKTRSTAINPSDCISWKLTNPGIEFVLSQAGNEFVVSRTIECFDPHEFLELDNKMPFREKLESISVRLARIMVNLARANGGKKLLDPFCGTGTMLIEGMRHGCEAIGIELSQEKCGKCERNLKWAKEKFGFASKTKVSCSDCTAISDFLKRGDFDFVATEPYMGPLIAKPLSESEAKRTAFQLEKTYFGLFRELKKTLPKKGLVSIVLPAIPYYDKLGHGEIPVSDKAWRENGFELHNELNELTPKALPYDYMAKKSRIKRRILVLELRN